MRPGLRLSSSLVARRPRLGVSGENAGAGGSINGGAAAPATLGASLSPHGRPVAIRMIEHGLLPMDRIFSRNPPPEAFAAGTALVAGRARPPKVTLRP